MSNTKWITIDLNKRKIMLHRHIAASLTKEEYKLIEEIAKIVEKYKKEDQPQ